MVAQLRDKAKEFEKRNAQIIIVESHEAHAIRYLARYARRDTKKWEERPIDQFLHGVGQWVTESGEFPCPVVTDPASTAGASYGVAFQHVSDSGLYCNRAATFLIDRDGMIRFIQNYKDTIPLYADELLQILDEVEEKRSLLTALKDKEQFAAAAELTLAPRRAEAETTVAIWGSGLDNSDAEIRAGAAAALCWLGYRAKDAVAALGKALADADPRVRRLSAEALGRIGAAAQPAVSDLVAALDQADANVRLMFSHILRTSPSPAEFVFPSVTQAITIEDEQVRIRNMTISALERIGASAMPGLIEGLSDDDPAIRMNHSEVLGRFGAHAQVAVPHLERLLKHDPDANVREAAVHGLTELRWNSPSFENALRDPAANVRIAATRAAERTGAIDEWPIVVALAETLHDRHPRVREATFANLDHAPPTMTLVTALRSRERERQLHAAKILGQFATAAYKNNEGEARLRRSLVEKALPALAETANHRDKKLKEIAAESLRRVQALSKEE